MHELGIVFHVVKQAEEVAEENKIKQIKNLTLEVGEVSGIEIPYFKDCFEWAKKRTKYMTECELTVIVIEGISYCRDCKETYNTVKHGRICPNCGSKDTYLVTGDQVVIKDIQVI